jgi:hypothetical protein
MGTNFDRLFQALPQESSPVYLCERIYLAILRERERESLLWQRGRVIISSLSGISSLVGLMFALPALMSAATASGFSTFASLFVSDSDLVVSHFSSFGLSLLEALPGFEVTLTLFLLTVFLVSLQNFVRGLSAGVMRIA